MPNYKIIVEYDGTNFFGWQLQQNQRCVQGDLEQAIKKIIKGKLARVHGAGRTDSGVHARGQVANFELERLWDVEKLRDALNGNLDEDVFVHHSEIVPDDFHSRYCATRRVYRYYCQTSKSVINRRFIWQIPTDISINKLRQCASLFIGDHDFTSFSKFDQDQENRHCIVYQSKWIKHGDFVIFTIESNRFLQHLIRYLVGTMMEVAKGNLSVNDFKMLLDAKDPRAKIYKAPPSGLFLEEVIYG